MVADAAAVAVAAVDAGAAVPASVDAAAVEALAGSVKPELYIISHPRGGKDGD